MHQYKFAAELYFEAESMSDAFVRLSEHFGKLARDEVSHLLNEGSTSAIGEPEFDQSLAQTHLWEVPQNGLFYDSHTRTWFRFASNGEKVPVSAAYAQAYLASANEEDPQAASTLPEGEPTEEQIQDRQRILDAFQEMAKDAAERGQKYSK